MSGSITFEPVGVVAGLDAVDGTPVLDIKPYMNAFGPQEPVRRPAWSSELTAGHW